MRVVQKGSKGPVRLAVAALAAAASLWAAHALAADGGASGSRSPSEAIFVAQVVALLFTGRLFGEIMLRLGQPAVVGQLIAGIVLGPSVFGLLAPHAQALIFPADHAQKAMTDGVAQFGVLLLLLLTGMETDVALVRRIGRPALSVSLSGIAVPFALGVAAGLTLLPDSLVPSADRRLVTALFLGTALSISSIKIVAMVIDEMHFMRRNLGQIIVASAIIDDTVGWIIIAVTFGLARPGGLDLGHLLVSIGGTVLFLAASATLGRWLVIRLMRWANDYLMSDLAVVTVILIVMGLMAIATDVIGVNTVLGAFVAGVLVGQSPILTRQVDAQLRGLVTAFFAPVFFGIAGLGTNLTILKDPVLLGLTIGLILIASLGKFGGAFLGGKLGRLSMNEALALALGMNARGSTEVIVATIGLSIGALNQTLFSMIVTMAVVTTTVMPPTLRWALGRLPLQKDEAARLDREMLEEHGFLGRVERLLLARDGGASGRLAARLCGLLAVSRALPVTVMPVGDKALSAETASIVGAASDVTVRPVEGDEEAAAVAQEGRKGYGLLVIGLEPATLAEGGLHPRLAGLAHQFEGTRAIVVARGAQKANPEGEGLRLLVPTTGTAAGRRAAEVAFAIGKAADAAVTVLHVTQPAERATSRPAASSARGRATHGDILDQVKAMARQFELQIETTVRAADNKGSAILGHARRAGHSLIVLGVEPRPTAQAPFGTLAEELLEGSEHSLLLVVGEGAMAATDEKSLRADVAATRSAA